jgi:hypothetical protein
MGGFAVVQAYGLERSTADIDVIGVVPYASTVALGDLAGKESALRLKHRIYPDVVTITTAPEDYQSRLVALFPNAWRHRRLFALEAHDLALTKLERNSERDRGDVQFLAGTGRLNAETLRQRYQEELRPYLLSRHSWHDQTLELWIEAYLPNG